MHFDPPPETVIGADGRPRLGLFTDTLARINGRDHDYHTPMGRPASRFARHFHYKQFQYFGVLSDSLLIGCALADTAYLGIAFFYLYDTASGELSEYTWRSPLARALTLSDSPTQGESRFQQRNVSIHMGYRATPDGQREKSLAVALPGLDLQASLIEPPGYAPMSICTRTGINGWTYANKVAGVPVAGVLRRHGREQDLSRLQRAGAHHDFSAGYMRRETFWNWACLSGQIEGRRLGVNLSCGVNETSVTENCLWLDDQLIKVEGVDFDYHPRDLDQPWRLRSHCGQIDLTFTPRGRHRERLNAGLFASNFQQLFGHFEGHIRPHHQAAIAVRDLHGFVEEQYAKW
ncbi:DUF2804 domain-containing protein [Alloalcanivorax mobilis]|uniref:DUF2804 domain-containing protein n=1 Tax=Alloalcanivorax mobilis TaxID=2019569 RepID=UPI000C7640E8|nr:DUF2804 domain-containing protein [Alloalcanivorax mobilis]